MRFAVGEHGEARLLVPLKAGEGAPAVMEAPALRIGVSRFRDEWQIHAISRPDMFGVRA